MPDRIIVIEEVLEAVAYLYKRIGFISLNWTLDYIMERAKEEKERENNKHIKNT